MSRCIYTLYNLTHLLALGDPALHVCGEEAGGDGPLRAGECVEVGAAIAERRGARRATKRKKRKGLGLGL